MTMGLKIHKMMREDDRTPREVQEEAKRRKDMSDNILEIIYNKIVNKKPRADLQDDEEEDWDS